MSGNIKRCPISTLIPFHDESHIKRCPIGALIQFHDESQGFIRYTNDILLPNSKILAENSVKFNKTFLFSSQLIIQ